MVAKTHPKALRICTLFMADLRQKLIERKVGPADCECWIWRGCLTADGYGKMKYRGTVYYVHRLSYAVFNDDIPAGYDIHHGCFEPSCYNPAHLFLMDSSTNRTIHSADGVPF